MSDNSTNGQPKTTKNELTDAKKELKREKRKLKKLQKRLDGKSNAQKQTNPPNPGASNAPGEGGKSKSRKPQPSNKVAKKVAKSEYSAIARSLMDISNNKTVILSREASSVPVADANPYVDIPVGFNYLNASGRSLPSTEWFAVQRKHPECALITYESNPNNHAVEYQFLSYDEDTQQPQLVSKISIDYIDVYHHVPWTYAIPTTSSIETFMGDLWLGATPDGIDLDNGRWFLLTAGMVVAVETGASVPTEVGGAECAIEFVLDRLITKGRVLEKEKVVSASYPTSKTNHTYTFGAITTTGWYRMRVICYHDADIPMTEIDKKYAQFKATNSPAQNRTDKGGEISLSASKERDSSVKSNFNKHYEGRSMVRDGQLATTDLSIASIQVATTGEVLACRTLPDFGKNILAVLQSCVQAANMWFWNVSPKEFQQGTTAWAQLAKEEDIVQFLTGGYEKVSRYGRRDLTNKVLKAANGGFAWVKSGDERDWEMSKYYSIRNSKIVDSFYPIYSPLQSNVVYSRITQSPGTDNSYLNAEDVILKCIWTIVYETADSWRDSKTSSYDPLVTMRAIAELAKVSFCFRNDDHVKSIVGTTARMAEGMGKMAEGLLPLLGAL